MNDLKFESRKSGNENIVVKISGDIDAYHSPKMKK